MTTHGPTSAGAPRRAECSERCHQQQHDDQQQQQQQQQHRHADLVLRVVVGTNPSSSSSTRVLRPFHTVCSEGRAAALRTIRHLQLDRCLGLGVPPASQLFVVRAADRASSLTLHSSQLARLIACLLQQQQQQELDGVAAQLQGALELDTAPLEGAGDAAGEVSPPGATSSSSSSSSTTTTTTTTTATSNAIGADDNLPPGRGWPLTMADVQFGPPWLRRLTVMGPITQDSVQQVAQLLDLLPSTRHLLELVLQEMPNSGTIGYLQGRMGMQFIDDFPASAVAQSASGAGQPQRLTSTSSSSSSRGSVTQRSSPRQPHSREGPSWRSSCRVLVASLKKPTAVPPPLTTLQPLLGSLERPRVLGIYHMQATQLPLYAASLRGLRGLYLAGIQECDEGVLACIAGLPQLECLGINVCRNPLPTMPRAFVSPGHLTNLDLTGTTLNEELLEGVCAATRLQSLDLHWASGFTTLPDSIGRLTDLRLLRLTLTQVVCLPETLTALTRLRALCWSQLMPIQPLDLEVLWGMTSVGFLVLGDHCLTTIPEGIRHLTRLHCLMLEGQELASLPSSISALVELRQLDLDAPQLQSLPDSVTALTKLEVVTAPGVVLGSQSTAVRAFLAARQAQGCEVQLAPAGSDGA